MSDGPSEQVARQIMTYFVRNPNAADSLEGIARWRLLDEAVHRTVGETSLALADLVKRGLLTCTPVQGGAPIYSLGTTAQPTARPFVAADGASPRNRQEND
jgi:hypothetical protein